MIKTNTKRVDMWGKAEDRWDYILSQFSLSQPVKRQESVEPEELRHNTTLDTFTFTPGDKY